MATFTYIQKLVLKCHLHKNVLDGFSYDEIAEIIDDICKN